jgi:hypothetical protein
LCGTRKKKRIRERRKGKCKEFESSYTLLPRGEGAGHNPLLDWTRTGCKRGTRLQFVLVEPRVSDVFVSSLFYRVGPRSSPLFIYTFSSLLGPPLLLLGMHGRFPKISLNRTNATLQSKLTSGGGQCQGAIPSVANRRTPLGRCCVSTSVSISISISLLLSVFLFPRKIDRAKLSLCSTKERNPGVWTWIWTWLGRNFAG